MSSSRRLVDEGVKDPGPLVGLLAQRCGWEARLTPIEGPRSRAHTTRLDLID